VSAPVRILSGIQPWWWIVLHLGKPIENRRKPLLGLDYRGDVLLHASRTKGAAADRAGWATARAFVAARFGESLAARIPPIDRLPRGGIVGRATVTGLVRPSCATGAPNDFPAGIDPRWWMRDHYAYLLSHATPTPFVPWRGSQAAVAAPSALLSALVEARAIDAHSEQGASVEDPLS
jgi:hypothetical protein